jgi:uncharacterized BrkB/YihY/UPF0761 family membrane protein
MAVVKPLSPVPEGFQGAEYRDAGRLWLALMVVLAVHVLVQLVLAFTVDPDSTRQSRLALWGTPLQVAVVVLFCMWIFRVQKNRMGLGQVPDHSAGWTVGSFFIPVANLVLPFFPMRDAWKGTAGGKRPVAVFLLWYLAWSLGLAVAIVAAVWAGIEAADAQRDAPEGTAPEDIMVDMPPGVEVLRWVGLGLMVVAAFGLFAMSRAMQQGQEEQAEAFASRSGAA